MVSFTFAEGGKSHLSKADSCSPSSSQVPQVVEITSSVSRLPLLRTSTGSGHLGCQSPRLGGSLSRADSSRNLDWSGRLPSDQLAGTAGCLPGPPGIPSPGDRGTRVSAHGQCHCKGTPQQTGRHQVEVPAVRGSGDRALGGTPSQLSSRRAHLRDQQYSSGLAEPSTGRRCGVEASSSHFSSSDSSVRLSCDRSLRHAPECSTTSLHRPLPRTSSRCCRCSAIPLASGPIVCLSSDLSDSQGHPQNPDRAGGGDIVSPSLASEALVCGPCVSFNRPALASPIRSGRPHSRCSISSRPALAQLDRLAVERQCLSAANIPGDVIQIIQASRRPSTDRIYSATWRAFCSYCASHDVSPLQASIVDVLVFLRKGFSEGLSPNTLRRQVAAISSVLRCGSLSSLAQHPLIRRFLRGAANISPPVLHRYPTWDLPLVLNSLMGPPYEPLRTTSLRLLSCKVAFLVAITSARRISEIAALSIRSDLCVFHADHVVLRLDPTFLPKVNSVFHRSQELILPNFCPRPSHPRERRWHTLDVRRALRIYLKRTAGVRRSESLFVSFLPVSLGLRVTASTIGRWIRQTIASAYDFRSLPRPARVTAHSTRSASTSAAWSTQASLLEICRAATWSSPVPFIRHYKIDTFASAEAAFGRQVLQQVVAGEVVSHQSGPTLPSGQ